MLPWCSDFGLGLCLTNSVLFPSLLFYLFAETSVVSFFILFYYVHCYVHELISIIVTTALVGKWRLVESRVLIKHSNTSRAICTFPCRMPLCRYVGKQPLPRHRTLPAALICQCEQASRWFDTAAESCSRQQFEFLSVSLAWWQRATALQCNSRYLSARRAAATTGSASGAWLTDCPTIAEDNFVVDVAAGSAAAQLEDVLLAPPVGHGYWLLQLFRRSYVCASREIETKVTARRSVTTELSLACAHF